MIPNGCEKDLRRDNFRGGTPIKASNGDTYRVPSMPLSGAERYFDAYAATVETRARYADLQADLSACLETEDKIEAPKEPTKKAWEEYKTQRAVFRKERESIMASLVQAQKDYLASAAEFIIMGLELNYAIPEAKQGKWSWDGMFAADAFTDVEQGLQGIEETSELFADAPPVDREEGDAEKKANSRS